MIKAQNASVEIPKIGCVQHDCDACLAAAKLNPREVYEANHAAREETKKNKKNAFEYIYQEEIGNGYFFIARLQDGELLFIFKDKHGIFNVFPTMCDYTMYCEGDLNGCQRVCINDDHIEEGQPGYEEGVDALDRYLRALP